MKMNFKAKLHYDFMTDQEHLVVRTDNGYLHSMVITTLAGPHETIQPLMTQDSREFIQAIMDAGWKAGLKPAGYEDASRELTATKYHLEDMRVLAKVKK